MSNKPVLTVLSMLNRNASQTGQQRAFRPTERMMSIQRFYLASQITWNV
uniref:Uncharacterized protein n=1 Tax=Anguilla anguilla TaxID=7936 RepID=A0A0E9U5W9_ANGAN